MAARLVVVACLTLALGPWIPPSAHTQTADDIVAKHIAAKGGAEKLRGINTVRSTGRITARGGEARVTSWAKRPNMFRRETVSMGQRFVAGFDGTTVWGINPLMNPGPQEVTGPPAEMTRQDADSFDSLLLDYQKSGTKVELVGTESGDAESLYHLKVTKKNGRVQHLYLSAETALEVRMVMAIEQAGIKGDLMTELGDYRSVEGIMVPFRIRQTFNGKPGAVVTYETIEFNVPIEDSFFKMTGK